MKTCINAVLSLFILSAGAAAETGAAAAGDLFTGARAVTLSLESSPAGIPTVSGASPVRQAPQAAPAARLSQAEKEAVLAALDPAGWSSASSQPYVNWWMPLQFRLEQGRLVADVRSSVMGGRITLPLRRAGVGYEFGPWLYCHSSMAEERCMFTVRVQFDVVSDSLLQGTIFSEWHRDGSQEEHSFTYKKK